MSYAAQGGTIVGINTCTVTSTTGCLHRRTDRKVGATGPVLDTPDGEHPGLSGIATRR